MRKLNNKKGFTAVCILVPVVTILAFVPKMVKEHRRRKYTSASI
ncbi:hypothetical protein [Anaerotignum sp.]|nr:hypothetical protein [Anaerotignum sp.]